MDLLDVRAGWSGDGINVNRNEMLDLLVQLCFWNECDTCAHRDMPNCPRRCVFADLSNEQLEESLRIFYQDPGNREYFEEFDMGVKME